MAGRTIKRYCNPVDTVELAVANSRLDRLTELAVEKGDYVEPVRYCSAFTKLMQKSISSIHHTSPEDK